MHSAAGLVQKCAVLFAVGSVWGRIAFSPQTNRSRVCLVRFWCAPECDCCILTCPNEPHQEGKRTIVRFNWTKWGRCEISHLSHIRHIVILWKIVTISEFSQYSSDIVDLIVQILFKLNWAGWWHQWIQWWTTYIWKLSVYCCLFTLLTHYFPI